MHSAFFVKFATTKRPKWKVYFLNSQLKLVYHRCSFKPNGALAYFAVEERTEFIDLVTSLVVVMPNCRLILNFGLCCNK